MRRFAVIGIVFATCLTLATQNASATSAGAIVFQGKASIATPICSPAKVVLGCANNPADAVLLGKASRAFNLVAPNPNTNLFCVGAAVNVNKAGKAPVQTDAGCSLNIGGTIVGGPLTLGPWCGKSEGTGIAGTITLAGNTITVSGGIYQSLGTLIVAAGNASKGAQTGVFASVVVAVPDATKGDSCVGGADEFLVTGVAASVVA